MRKRNPMARELRLNPLYRARCGKTRRQAEQRADRWNRAAKHKPPKGTPGSDHGSGDSFCGSEQRNLLPQMLPPESWPCGNLVGITYNQLIYLAPGVGLEPTTQRLTAACSTD